MKLINLFMLAMTIVIPMASLSQEKVIIYDPTANAEWNPTALKPENYPNK